MRLGWHSVWICFGLFLSSAPLFGQEEEEDLFAPGLVADYAAPGSMCRRLDRQLTFRWGGSVPDQRLRPGPFTATWRGYLLSQVNGEYRLHVHGAGRVELSLRGKKLIDARLTEPGWVSSPPISLEYDYHPVEVRFERLNDQAALACYWSGPQFSLEPIDGRQWFHDRSQSPSTDFEHGRTLARALRCAACHDWPGAESQSLPGPSLQKLSGTVHREWLVEWLTAKGNPAKDDAEAMAPSVQRSSRRMPHLPMTDEEASLIAAWLLEQSQPVPPLPPPPPRKETGKSKEKAKNKDSTAEGAEPEKSPVEVGRDLTLSTGCLACHQLDGLGTPGWFSGGDLTQIGAKRPTDFFRRWLTDPARLNPDHRMPVFDLTVEERESVVAFLSSLAPRPPASAKPVASSALRLAERERAQQLIGQHRCAACHALPGGEPSPRPTRAKLAADANWDRSCVVDGGGRPASSPERETAAKEKIGSTTARPRYRLSEIEQRAIREYITQVASVETGTEAAGRALAVEQNCLACHQRGESPGLAPRLTAIGERHPDLASRIPAMTPPSLLSVGDKLHDATLLAVLTRAAPPHRPYLSVRMPKFRITAAEAQSVADYLIGQDRIPAGRPELVPPPTSTLDAATLHAVGSRLVTPDGFGCTSCHQIGKVLPVKAPLNARGPDLSRMGERIRREWYERWVRNPARIVPRMEMPSVQIAVRGLKPESLDEQLSAVWDVLNQPGFQPPEPNPVRVVRHTGTHPDQRALVVTDVLRLATKPVLKPLLIGLSNRHNVLFDLESGRLRGWSVGDTARQRTEGKSWYWEAAGIPLLELDTMVPELVLRRASSEETPRAVGQFITEFDELTHRGPTFEFRYRLHFGDSPQAIQVRQSLTPLPPSSPGEGTTGFRRTIDLQGAAGGESFRLGILDSATASKASRLPDGRGWKSVSGPPWSVRVESPAEAEIGPEGVFVSADSMGTARVIVDYVSPIPIDQFLVESPAPGSIASEQLSVVPGFTATRLPLTDEIMPTALAFRPNGTLVIASLKGQVWQAHDQDRDGMADQLQAFSDELAAPYGLFATDEYIDVVNKYSLLRLLDEDRDGFAERTSTLASGWGHTTDYHDWAVGLPRDDEGNYYIALPCQQDQRSVAAAKHRGEFLKLAPREPTSDDPRRYRIETVSRGHRFPMGIARRRDGEFFVSDNQGNYNPFNELNWVRPGAHFGFINTLEKGTQPMPPLTNPAVNLPHPWVRSVNGICFLETPPAVKQQLGHAAFGPFEGDLIGCEYDTRRLIRVSFQRVGDEIQGAAYPFSFDQPPAGPPLLGPLVCTISPNGELYVGGIRDSGWGGANNIGEVVRLRLDPSQLPCGIAKMQAVSDGFELEFTSPVVADLAADPRRYSLASYTRQSTPAYGGPDLRHRVETIGQIVVSADGRRVRLAVPDLRIGFVYELHVKSLVADGAPFFPAEAHFTLSSIP